MKKCDKCGFEIPEAKADRVSVKGIYDMHLFHSIEGKSVDEIIMNWMCHIADKIPATVGGKKVEDMGPSSLCPVIVLEGDSEIRRVGEMVPTCDATRLPKSAKALKKFREDLLSDPDIPRILAMRS